VSPPVGPNAACDATVLVCSRDRPRLLAETVASVLASSRVPRELLVVDQSTVAQGELAALGGVRGCTVTYLHTTERGLSRARNTGLRAAAYDIVVLLDDDMLVEPEWLGCLLAGFVDGGACTVVTGRVLAGPHEEGDGVVPPAALVTQPTAAVYRGRQSTDVMAGANVALHREVAIAIGGFDERLGAGARFPSAEDNDMGLRLLDAGCEVRHVPGAVVLHRAWRSPRERALMRWRYGRGKGAFYAKHMRRSDPYALARLRADARARIAAAQRGLPHSPRASAGQLLYLAGMLTGAAQWLLYERRRRARTWL
jgi:GT2 family glycosyltransferase